MNESPGKHFPELGSGTEEARKRPDVIDVPTDKKEKKVDIFPLAQYNKIYQKIMMEFGYKIINSKEKSLAIPHSMESTIKHYDTAQLVDEIEDTKKEDWKGREVLFKAITDEIYLRLWELRKGSKRKTRSAEILRIK